MILAFHSIFTAYGFWLPNDPRGTWSDFVRQWELFLHGKATTIDTRRSVAHRPHDQNAREAAKEALMYPPVTFTGEQALSISRGFVKAMEDSGYVLHACSILPRHVHLVIARHPRNIKRIVGHLKGAATHQLHEDRRHPLNGQMTNDGSTPSPWARKSWDVYLDSHEAVRRAVRYVQDNPVKEGKPAQRWSFVRDYEG
ncbi:MAG: hypothetical protein GC162_06650 [Planctomycetes bacterium]|nr:hypothetical protein [Planctomycetota bacterium]